MRTNDWLLKLSASTLNLTSRLLWGGWWLGNAFKHQAPHMLHKSSGLHIPQKTTHGWLTTSSLVPFNGFRGIVRILLFPFSSFLLRLSFFVACSFHLSFSMFLSFSLPSSFLFLSFSFLWPFLSALLRDKLRGRSIHAAVLPSAQEALLATATRPTRQAPWPTSTSLLT